MDGTGGVVLNIQRQCVHDGPGVRSVVFLKGCPLRCLWCANPEAQDGRVQIGAEPARCIGDGACAAACPTGAIGPGPRIDRALCARCGSCADECFSGALKRFGSVRTVRDVTESLLRDRVFFARGGGVTLSGGEPFFQPEFALRLLRELRAAGVHTAVETCGEADADALLDARADVYLYDLKHMDPDRHRAYTGAGNERILRNFAALAGAGRQVVPRFPLVPGCNDGEDNLLAMARFLREMRIGTLHLLPFHQMGEGKYRMLDAAYGLRSRRAASDEDISRAVRVLEGASLCVVLNG